MDAAGDGLRLRIVVPAGAVGGPDGEVALGRSPEDLAAVVAVELASLAPVVHVEEHGLALPLEALEGSLEAVGLEVGGSTSTPGCPEGGTLIELSAGAACAIAAHGEPAVLVPELELDGGLICESVHGAIIHPEQSVRNYRPQRTGALGVRLRR